MAFLRDPSPQGDDKSFTDHLAEIDRLAGMAITAATLVAVALIGAVIFATIVAYDHLRTPPAIKRIVTVRQ